MSPPRLRPGSLTADQRQLLDRLLDEQSPRVQPEITRTVDRTRVELSSAQRRIWFFDRLQPGSPLYVITGVARLTGSLDLAVLRRCLDEVVRRHEVLRTTFHGDDEPWSKVNEAVPVPLDVVDLSESPEPARTTAVEQRLRREARRPFDLSSDLMLRAALLRTAPDEHLFQLSMHHIAADGWSLGVLLRDLGALYSAFAQGRPSPLPELAVQYSDFAVWQRAQLREPAQEKLLQDWVDHLAGAVPIDLPTDRPRGASESFAGACVALELPVELVTEIKLLANAQQATPYMVLLAALAALLSHWSGSQRDVVLGCAVAGRNRIETEPLVGFFVNTLALRMDLGGAPSFRALVDRARTGCLDGYARQDVPFERVVEALHPERHPAARVPLVRHMLVLHNTPRPEVRLPGLHMQMLPLETGTAKFDLQIELAPTTSGALTGWVEYSCDLFDEATVRRLADSWLLLLTEAVQRPDTGLGELPMLSRDDRAAVVERWSGAGVAALGDGCLHQLFERRADLTPHAHSVVHGDTILTYGELEQRANRLANRLRSLGVGWEDVVGICLPRSADAIVAMLAVLKAGAAYLPLDPGYPAQRLALMAADASARLVITTSRPESDLVVEGQWRTLCVDDESVRNSPPNRPRVQVQPRNAAYVIYTSGSTGIQKGAVNEHAAVVNRILWMQQAYQLDQAESVLHKTPLGFDVAGWEWLWPLAVGARVVVADQDTHRDPAHIAQLVVEHGVTTCHFVPSMLRAFLDEPAAERCASVLRRLVCSGEELPPALAERTRVLLPDVALHNLYGPTEAAIDVTAWSVPHQATPEHAARLPIGSPISGARLYVLDDALRPAPPGVPGELFIGGTPVCRGYLGRPGLTAERFVPDPFHGGQRLYRTGDRARWVSDGALEFLGRLDFQVKVRGQRIEPGEVEAALAAHPAVDRVVVEPYRDAAGDVQLAAYSSLRATDAQGQITGQVERWQAIFDDTYRSAAPADPELDLSGWVDSYAGDPIPEREMREWVDETAGRITALRPTRLLEIGCGTGLLALRLAPRCEYYCGTDISAEALAQLEPRVARLASEGTDGPDRTVELAQRAADDFSQWAPGDFDTVVLNSVTQYLPDVDYLVRVLRGALAVLRPGGHLFVGDVRSLPLLEALHCSILLHRLPSQTPPGTLRRLTAQQVAREEELVVHPALFQAVAAPGAAVTVLAKSSPYRNELTRFRYDVVVAVPPVPEEDAQEWVTWPGPAGAPPREAARSFGWLEVPDARLAEDLLAVRLMHQATQESELATVGALRRAVAERATYPMAEPATLTAPGYQVVPHLGAEPGTLGVEFRATGGLALPHRTVPPPIGHEAGWAAYTNDPPGAASRRLMVSTLREHAMRTLPTHMVPASLTVLKDWPVGANGKLDRAALPAPDGLRPLVGTSYVAPRTDTERAVAGVWQEVLGVDRIGVHDDFFALGGHSMLAVHLVSRLRALLGRDLVLGGLLRTPTIAAVSAVLEAAQDTGADVAPIGRAQRRRRGPDRDSAVPARQRGSSR